MTEGQLSEEFNNAINLTLELGEVVSKRMPEPSTANHRLVAYVLTNLAQTTLEAIERNGEQLHVHEMWLLQALESYAKARMDWRVKTST